MEAPAIQFPVVAVGKAKSPIKLEIRQLKKDEKLLELPRKPLQGNADFDVDIFSTKDRIIICRTRAEPPAPIGPAYFRNYVYSLLQDFPPWRKRLDLDDRDVVCPPLPKKEVPEKDLEQKFFEMILLHSDNWPFVQRCVYACHEHPLQVRMQLLIRLLDPDCPFKPDMLRTKEGWAAHQRKLVPNLSVHFQIGSEYYYPLIATKDPKDALCTRAPSQPPMEMLHFAPQYYKLQAAIYGLKNEQITGNDIDELFREIILARRDICLALTLWGFQVDPDLINKEMKQQRFGELPNELEKLKNAFFTQS